MSASDGSLAVICEALPARAGLPDNQSDVEARSRFRMRLPVLGMLLFP